MKKYLPGDMEIPTWRYGNTHMEMKKYLPGYMEISTHSTVSGFCGNQSLEESFCWQIPFPTLISIHKIGNLQTGPGLEISSQELRYILNFVNQRKCLKYIHYLKT